MAKIKVTLTKSTIGCKQDQIATVKALGLKKIRDEKTHEATPQIILVKILIMLQYQLCQQA